MTSAEKTIELLEKAHRLLATLEIPMSEYRPISTDILSAIKKLKPNNQPIKIDNNEHPIL